MRCPFVRALLISLTLMSLTFAGCTEPEAAAEPADEAHVVTDPTDYSYVENDTGAHVHDYWGGEDTLTIIDESRSCQGCRSSSNAGNVIMGSYRPDPDFVIPQGTAWVNVTATWEIGDSQFDEVQLHVKTAAMAEPEFYAVIENGQTISFNSTNDDNDPPHHVLSLWQFYLRAASEGGDVFIQDFDTTMRVTATRGLEIPPYPSHPDFWQGASELILGQGSRTIQQYGYQTPAGGSSTSCFGGCIGRFELDDGAVVPFDATTLEVRFDYEPGSVPTLGLEFHGAGTWDFSPIEPSTEAPDHTIWTIDVQEHFGDSPYAKQTLWEFRMTWDESTPARAYQGTVSHTVTAIKA